MRYALAAALLVVPAAASAQLRPLDPFEWRLLDAPLTVSAEAGGGWLRGQRASLAGTEGTLVEAGSFRAHWRTGRVVLEAAGTVRRLFDDERRFAAPEPTVTEGGPDRADSGDYRVATAVRLTPERWPLAGILRFGTRLPTTDDRVGLDRDATDFFALVGARLRRGAVALAAETGVAINGTRQAAFEQDDLLLYILRAEYLGATGIVPSLTVTGQQVGSGHAELRGNESLGEVRMGFRAGERRWVRAEAVKGFTAFSPGWGVLVSVGMAR
ncbi:MAG TPA: hypothetical protein VFX98_12325 [Longimicrobiaceae bacterium]|nr:hypothetical protein [Longimicrobiaceae bacterium]